MLLSLNSDVYSQVSKRQFAEVLDSLLQQFETFYSVKIETVTEDEHFVQELSAAGQPLDPNDPRFQALIKKGKPKNDESKTK